jgi:glyoxylase-like metal-dependent hydrolase (beta-lactamase superfamily II)
LFTGDTVVTNLPPLMSEANTAVWLETIDRMKNWPDPIYHIIPGRGEPGNLQTLTVVANYIQTMRQRIQDHIDAQRPRDEIQSYLQEFLGRYPHTQLPPDWLKRQIKYSLDRVYDEIQLNASN